MKKFLSYLLIILTLPCCGQNDKRDKKEPPSSINNSLIPEKPVGWVSDFANILTKEQAELLESILVLREAKDNEIAVVTMNLDSSGIKTDEDFNKYSLALFKKWGVGKKEDNNGVGILLCPNLKRIRIEVGLGLESKLSNLECQHIIDSIMIPEFKNKDYYTGILKGIASIVTEIK